MVLQFIVRYIGSIDELIADVSANGGVTSHDASWILRRVTNPALVFPCETGGPAKQAPQTARTLSWVARDGGWDLVADDPTGIYSGELALAVASSDVTVHDGGEGLIAANRTGGRLLVAFARTEAPPVLLRVEGDKHPPMILDIDLNEGDVPIAEIVVPTQFALSQNTPNPFNPSTTIQFSLPVAVAVRLAVYSTDGRLVRTLVDERAEPGHHAVVWDGADALGRQVASGVYLYRLTTAANAKQATLVRRMLLVR